jgi:probable HAF family extracellular repeat protein
MRATYWDTLTSTPTELTRPSTFTDAEADQISNPDILGNPAVIVGTGTNSTAKAHAVRWDTKDSNGTDLGTLSPTITSLQSFGYGVSPRGWTVGKSQAVASGVFHAFATPKFRAMGGQDNLSPVSSGDGPLSEAHSINGLGQIAGSSQAFPSVPLHAYIWYLTDDGTTVTLSSKDLGTVGGATSGAFSINNRGQVVGWSYKSDNSLTSFIWVPGWTAPRDLKSFLSSSDQSARSVLTAATSITDDGVIVGYGKQTGVSYYNGFVIKLK